VAVWRDWNNQPADRWPIVDRRRSVVLAVRSSHLAIQDRSRIDFGWRRFP